MGYDAMLRTGDKSVEELVMLSTSIIASENDSLFGNQGLLSNIFLKS